MTDSVHYNKAAFQQHFCVPNILNLYLIFILLMNIVFTNKSLILLLSHTALSTL